MAFIIVAAGPMTACRMRTIPAGRALSCVLVVALVLMAAVSLSATAWRKARPANAVRPGSSAAGSSFDLKRTEGRVVIDRIGDLSGRLIRLEIEAAALARRLGVAPSPVKVEPVECGAGS